MNKKGRLSQAEKYIIQGAVSDGISIKEIASMIERTTQTVQRYIDNELDSLVSHVTNAQVQQYEKRIKELQAKNKKLYEAKLESDKAHAPKKEDVTVLNTMTTKTDSGKGGVAIMTKTAADISDKGRKQNLKESKNKLSRSAKGNLFDIKKNKIIKE